jgi:putative ABC transport system permease protein
MSDRSVPRWRRYLRLARPNAAADVEEELQFHLAMRIERNIALGMDPETARRDASLRFGDMDGVRATLVEHDRREERRQRMTDYVADFMQDVRFGLRSLRRAPGFAVASIVTLALGIGANAAIFSVVNAVILRPLPYARPAELVSIGQGSNAEFQLLRERLRGFAEIGVYVAQTHPIDDGDEALRVEGAAITANMLRLLGVTPMLGRGFTDEDATFGANTALLLSHKLWQGQFSGARDVIGKRVIVEGVAHTVIGVMPPDFRFPNRDAQYWQPFAMNPANVGFHWAVGGKSIIGRLKPGVTLDQAQRDVREVWPGLRMLNPLWDPGPEYRRDVTVAPLQTDIVGSTGRLLWILFGCVFVVLLIGCVNVANLLLARATARDRELAVRAALGGGRGRLIRQLVTESVLLSTAGSVLGILLAYFAVRSLVAVMPAGVPRAHEIAVNGWVIVFTAGVAIVTALLFGIIPAMRATNFAKQAGSSVGRRSTRDVQHHRVSGILVTAEMALAVLLVVGAVLLVRSFSALRAVEPGFQTEHVIAARISPPSGAYRDPARVSALYEDVLQRVRAVPGVVSVGAVDKLPLAQTIWGIATRVEGQFEDARRLLPEIAHWQMVTPRYFETMRIAVTRGRAFTDADRDGQLPVTIVSESVARRFWPGQDPLGRRIGYPYDSPWLTVVGVVPDTKQDSLRDTASTSMYVPWQQRTRMSGNEMWLVARTAGSPATFGPAIRSIVREVDRAVPVSDVRTMDAVVAASVHKARFTTLLVGLFAACALLLGAIGIYGVMSYLVSQRTQEMGIRIALGATRFGVIGLVVGRATRLAVIGAGVGVLAAFFATRSLGSLLYSVSSSDPVTFVAVPLGFLLIALLASYAPALRATRVDPVKALRAD